MEKLKIYLAVVKKYQFWGLCGTVLVTSLVCWWLATSGLADQFKKEKDKINGDFTNVKIDSNPPNKAVIEKIKTQHELLKKGVYKAWETLYLAQKEKNPFPAKLGDSFKNAFEKLKQGDDLDLDVRQNYQRYIKEYLPELQKMVNVLRPVEKKDEKGGNKSTRPEMAMAGQPAAGAEAETTGAVYWNPTDYERLKKDFEWHGQAPSTLAVVLAQEDLWVYGALLRVIKNTNKIGDKDATSQSNAIVKKIEALEIGNAASKSWMGAEFPILLPTATSTPANAQNPAGPSGTETKSADELLLEKRYVDEKGKPLPKEKTFPYPKNLETEYKMMPIRMSLVIDQRELPKLLAECANSDMPIEVRRIRFIKSTEDTPMTATPRAGGGTMGPPPPGAMGPGGMMGPQGRMGPGMGPGMGYPPPGYMPPPTPTAPTGGAPADMGNLPQEAGQYDIPVEIYAILYIYNPPNIAKLGTGAASTTNPAEAVAPASSTTTPGGQATPAANPANPAAVPATRPPAKP